MKRATVAACVFGFLALFGSRASASPIQPPVWQANGDNVGFSWTSQTFDQNASVSGFVTFDSFSYAADTAVGGVTWYGIFLDVVNNVVVNGGTQNTSRWDLLIESSSGPGGTPGGLIGGELDANVQRTTVGTGLFGNTPVTVYKFVANFPTFNAIGGMTYWFAPVSVGVQDNFFPFFSWIQGTGGDGSAYQVQLNQLVVVDAEVRPGDRAFELTAVPEPASLTLLGSGLLAVARRRLRRRS